MRYNYRYERQLKYMTTSYTIKFSKFTDFLG